MWLLWNQDSLADLLVISESSSNIDAPNGEKIGKLYRTTDLNGDDQLEFTLIHELISDPLHGDALLDDATILPVGPGQAEFSSTTGFSPIHTTVLGDVNGDGLEDIGVLIPLLADGITGPGQVPPSFGRAYVSLGRPGDLDASNPAVVSVMLTDSVTGVSYSGSLVANAVYEDFSLGGVFAVGDVNNDGYDDFAVARTLEDSGFAQGGVAIVFGSPLGLKTQIVDPADPFDYTQAEDAASLFGTADIVISQASGGSLSGGTRIESDLSVSAGDIDGDGRMDLFLGADPQRSLRCGPGWHPGRFANERSGFRVPWCLAGCVGCRGAVEYR